jgi:hypothetical protein
LTADGKWRSFPKVPNLLQYVVAGKYYARAGWMASRFVSGSKPACLPGNTAFAEKLKEMRNPKVVVGTFAAGQLQSERQTNSDQSFADLRPEVCSNVTAKPAGKFMSMCRKFGAPQVHQSFANGALE